MKITGITTRLLEIDPAPRYRDGRIPADRPTRWHFPLVTVHTDDGLEGHSMAYGPHGDGAALAAIVRDVYARDLVGQDPLYVERIWQQLHRKQRHLYHETDALLGVLDVALWDLRGKAFGRSIADLLGRFRDWLPCYATARSEAYTAEELAAEARAMAAAGFHGYKLQVRAGPESDLPRLRAVREAVGPDFPLMHDPNGSYTFDEAWRVGRALEELDYRWYEEPLRDAQVSLLRRLQQSLRLPLLVGETSRFIESHAFLIDGAFSLIRGDVLLKGGITGLRKLFAAAETCGVGLEIHTANTPLLDVAHLHVAGACANTLYIENHHPIFRFALKHGPLEADRQGRVAVPTGPGLGVELDWDWIDNHTVAET